MRDLFLAKEENDTFTGFGLGTSSKALASLGANSTLRRF